MPTARRSFHSWSPSFHALLPRILIELKAEKNCTEQQLEELAQTALRQINNRRYDTDLQAMGLLPVIKIGIAFSGKKARIAVER